MKRLLSGCLALVVVFLAIPVVGLNQANRYWWQEPKNGVEAQEFTVSEGESFSDVAKHLEEQELIANAFWFRVDAELAGATNLIKPGTYTFRPGLNYKQVLAILTAGTTEADIRVTIPEGYTIKQMGEILENKGLVTIEEWTKVTGQFSPLESHPFVVMAQKPDDVDLEGYLFPDTYRFFADATAEEIATTMLENMEKRVSDLGAVPNGDAEGMTIHEVLTLASIVEREVRKPETMKNVADIFLKRLDIGMALQADSTVNYVTGGTDPSISLEDRDNTDSPYNTYKYPGLPPGPISNPGVNAIDAVLNPIHNDYFYFLTTDDGEIYYAKTHDEHVANKAIYLK